MTKSKIIEELHSCGEVWANNSYSKEYLEKYLEEYKEATKKTIEELYAAIKAKNKNNI